MASTAGGSASTCTTSTASYFLAHTSVVLFNLSVVTTRYALESGYKRQAYTRRKKSSSIFCRFAPSGFKLDLAIPNICCMKLLGNVNNEGCRALRYRSRFPFAKPAATFDATHGKHLSNAVVCKRRTPGCWKKLGFKKQVSQHLFLTHNGKVTCEIRSSAQTWFSNIRIPKGLFKQLLWLLVGGGAVSAAERWIK